jgi:enoyl-CoA hydratase/carnithine racemase
VVVVGGVAFGWGTELTLAADYVIATDGARFSLPETGLGILPGAGGSTELQRRIGPAHALRLGMTGEVIDADEALRIGLVQERRATVDLALVRAFALARQAAPRSPTALAAVKEAKFRSFVGPGAALSVTARRIHDGSGYAVASARIDSAGKRVCDAELTLRTMPFPTPDLEAAMRDRAAAIGLTVPAA